MSNSLVLDCVSEYIAYTPRIQCSGDGGTSHAYNLSSLCSVVSTSAPIHGFTQLGLRSHPTGSSADETITMTFLLCGPDKLVYTTASSDQSVLGLLHRQWQDLSFLTTGIHIRPFQADITIIKDASTHGWGAHMGTNIFQASGLLQTAGSISVV